MKYKKGYKYQVAEEDCWMSNVTGLSAVGDFYKICESGLIIARKGYAYDGPSGPTIDTKTFLRGALFHDIAFQATREGKIPRNKELFHAWNQMLIDICDNAGMWKIRQKWVLFGVDKGSYWATDPKNDNPILEAP